MLTTIGLLTNGYSKDHRTHQTLDPFQEELKIEISETNLTLDEYTDVNIAQIFDPLLGLNIVKNSTVLAGSPAYKVEYNTTQGLNQLKVMEIWTIIEGKSYDSIYSALSEEYFDYLPTVKKMLDSVKIIMSNDKSNNNNKSQFNAGNLSLYESPQLSILYPTAWEMPKEGMGDDKVRSGKAKIVIFRSPFEDGGSVAPSWHEITFTMAIDIDSVHDAGTDYRTIYSRVPYNVWTGNWARQVQEISAYDDARVLDETNNYTIFDKNSQETKYILFSFDLEKINSPQRYKAVFYMTDYFVRDRSFCRMIDTTNWVIIPPPEFSMLASPSSIVLRPGEEKDVELQIKGNTDLQSEASLSVGNNYNATEFNISLVPSKASIPASGTGSSALHIKALDSAKPKPYTFPIVANISFPTSITNRGGETFSNNRSVNVIESSNLTLTVLPPYTDAEKLSNFTTTWITPVQGIWTFLAGVGAVIAPVIITLYRKRKKKDD